MEEQTVLGWRESLWIEFIDLFGKGPRVQRAFTHTWGITPDNVTAIKLWWSIVILLATLSGILTPKLLLVGVICCFLSDFFDGPLKRALDEIGWEPAKFILAEKIPVFTGRPFDQITDRIAIIIGCIALIYLGIPWTIIAILLPWSVMKVLASFHGAWLVGMRYSDLGKAMMGEQTPELAEDLGQYASRILQPALIGRAEVFIQTAVLLGGTAWILIPNADLLAICRGLAWIAFVAGMWSYRIYVRRFLKDIEASFRQFQVRTDLPFTARNHHRLWLSRLVLGAAAYFRLQPQSNGNLSVK